MFLVPNEDIVAHIELYFDNLMQSNAKRKAQGATNIYRWVHLHFDILAAEKPDFEQRQGTKRVS